MDRTFDHAAFLAHLNLDDAPIPDIYRTLVRLGWSGSEGTLRNYLAGHTIPTLKAGLLLLEQFGRGLTDREYAAELYEAIFPKPKGDPA